MYELNSIKMNKRRCRRASNIFCPQWSPAKALTLMWTINIEVGNTRWRLDRGRVW